MLETDTLKMTKKWSWQWGAVYTGWHCLTRNLEFGVCILSFHGNDTPFFVILQHSVIPHLMRNLEFKVWIPAFVGMTMKIKGMTVSYFITIRQSADVWILSFRGNDRGFNIYYSL